MPDVYDDMYSVYQDKEPIVRCNVCSAHELSSPSRSRHLHHLPPFMDNLFFLFSSFLSTLLPGVGACPAGTVSALAARPARLVGSSTSLMGLLTLLAPKLGLRARPWSLIRLTKPLMLLSLFRLLSLLASSGDVSGRSAPLVVRPGLDVPDAASDRLDWTDCEVDMRGMGGNEIRFSGVAVPLFFDGVDREVAAPMVVEAEGAGGKGSARGAGTSAEEACPGESMPVWLRPSAATFSGLVSVVADGLAACCPVC